MKTVAVYTRDGIIASSSYYRIWQYFSKIESCKVLPRIFIPTFLTRAQYNTSANSFYGVFVRGIYHLFVYFGALFYFLKDSFFPPDCVVILRSVTPKSFVFPINILYSTVLTRTQKVVWDFDDNIVVSNEISQKEKTLLENKADQIVVTHSALFSVLKTENVKKVTCLCTTDGDFFCGNWPDLEKKRLESFKNEVRILWLTSSSGFVDIKKIRNILDESAKRVQSILGKKLVLVVVCNKPYEEKFDFLTVENHTWDRKIALKYCETSHIGIMPLMKTEFALGKGAFKIVQYFAAGLPVIASKVGFNEHVVKDNENGFCLLDDDNQNLWSDSIMALAKDEELWKRFSENARLSWNQNFNYKKNFEFWSQIAER